VLGNLGNIISLRQGHNLCVRQASAALNLVPWQESEIARLPNRRAIARFSRYGAPICLAIPDARDIGLGMLPRASIDEARNRSKAALDAIPYVKRRAPPLPAPWVLNTAEQPQAQTQPSPGNGLLPEEMRLLIQVAERPWELIETRMDSLGLDREAEGEIRSRLETKGLIESIGTAGARHRLFDLTARGREVCHKGGIALPHSNTGKGKVAHQCIVEYTQRTLGRLSTRFPFQRAGVSFSTRGVQPDVLLITSSGGRVPIQAACHNQPAYEADALLKLHALTQLDPEHTDRVDFVLAVSVSKRHRDAIARALKRQNNGNLPERLVLLEFDSAVDPKFDWTPTFEMAI